MIDKARKVTFEWLINQVLPVKGRVILPFLKVVAFILLIFPQFCKAEKDLHQDLIPSIDQAENSGRYYLEQYTLAFYLTKGYRGYISFILSNMGLQKGYAVLKSEFKTPDQKSYDHKSKYARDEWRFKKSNFNLTLGKDGGSNSIQTGEDGKIIVQIDNPKIQARYELTNLIDPIRPKDFLVFYGSKERYYRLVLFIPWGKVKGKVLVKSSGRVHQVEGFVYADHSLTNVSPRKQARTWYRMRQKVDDTIVTFIVFTVPGIKKLNGFVMVARENKILFYSDRIKFYARNKKEFDNGDKIPRALRIIASNNGKKLRATMLGEKIIKAQSMLSGFNSMIRFVLSKLVDPWDYETACKWIFEINGTDAKKISGKGIFSVTTTDR